MAQSSTMRRIHATVRWIPFIFIISILLFGFGVLVNLHVSYTMVQKHRYISSIINIILTTFFAGMAIWSFLVAVFRNPGHPHGVKGKEWDTRHLNGGDEESHWERHHRLREEQVGLQDDMDDDEDGEGSENGQSAQSPLLPGGIESRQRGEDPNTELFHSSIIPGQPQMPARTGRAQLNDVISIVDRARQERSDGRIFLSGLQVKNTGDRRWCKQCNCEKPDRAHHCSTCGVCILRMDHHCPWLASKCIGLRNHKGFFLFLFYTAVFCCFAAQDSARVLVAYVEEESNGYETTPITWAVVMFLGLIFGLALVPFCAYHAYLMCRNRTTIESMEGSGRVRISLNRSESLPKRESVTDRLRRLAPSSNDGQTRNSLDRSGNEQEGDQWKRDEELTREERKTLRKANKLNIYDVDIRRNWCSLMGDRWPLWWFPVGEPEGDGNSYEVNEKTLHKLEEITTMIRDMNKNTRSNPELSSHSSSQDHQNRHKFSNAFSSPVSSIRSKARNSLRSVSDQNQNLNRDSSSNDTSNSRRQTGHGVVEWGAPPKRDFVLYGIDDDDLDKGGIFNKQDSRSNQSQSNNTSNLNQMDAEVWSS